MGNTFGAEIGAKNDDQKATKNIISENLQNHSRIHTYEHIGWKCELEVVVRWTRTRMWRQARRRNENRWTIWCDSLIVEMVWKWKSVLKMLMFLISLTTYSDFYRTTILTTIWLLGHGLIAVFALKYVQPRKLNALH